MGPEGTDRISNPGGSPCRFVQPGAGTAHQDPWPSDDKTRYFYPSTGAAMELIYQIAINMIPGVGGITGKKLIDACGSAAGVFQENKASLMKISGVGEKTAASIGSYRDFDRAEKELSFLKKHGIRTLCYSGPDYPKRLRHCADGPLLLYVKGEADLNAEKIVAVVGTRRISEYGRKKCQDIVEGLSAYGVLVVSGLAYGVDACAHRAAMDCGLPTVGVLGHGLDRIYPALHAGLARKMLDGGALVTDFSTGTLPERENFPRRNRIIAGLCDAVVVIEAAITGGALITAEIANTYNRDVFALPGRTTDPYSMGCNKLIKSHKANLVESAEDLEFIMNWKPIPGAGKPRQPKHFPPLTKDESRLVDVLLNAPASGIDLLAATAGFSSGKINSLLLTLELKGVVHPLPGKEFTLTAGYQESR